MTGVNELEGQALREAIARAKGWELEETKRGAIWHTLSGLDVRSLPKWDESLVAAFSMIDGFWYDIRNDPDTLAEGKRVKVQISDKTICGHYGHADTVPLAICRAWLAMKQAETVSA